jgi:putative transposase
VPNVGQHAQHHLAAALEEIRDWQNRPLDPVYPVVFFDALRVKIGDLRGMIRIKGLVRNKAA